MKNKAKTLKKKPVWTIGWREKVDLPELNLFGIKAKTDTGALSSVLHCGHIKLIEIDGEKLIEFIPLSSKSKLKNKNSIKGQTFTFPYQGVKKIKNSFGIEESRYYIRTTIQLFNQEFSIEITLRDRSEMEFPMLLGRSFVRGKFLVDVSQSYISEKTIDYFQKDQK